MKLLVIGTYKRSLDNVGFNNLVLGLSKIGADFDHYPNILTQSDRVEEKYLPKSIYGKIAYPEYSTIVKNLKKKHYDLIITRVCFVNYNAGKHGFLSKISRQLKYSLPSNKHKLGGTLVTNWIKAGIKLPPFIVFDDTDDPFIWPVDFDLLWNCSVYFKRELPFDRFACFRLFESKLNWHNRGYSKQRLILADKIRPIWISYDNSTISSLFETDVEKIKPYKERDIDISHLCDMDVSYNRTKILPLLDALGTQYNVVTTEKGRFSRKEYFELTKRSKIAITFEGRGWDCPKHYEIMLCGTLLFVARPSIEITINLKNGENCIFMENNLSNFEELARYYLDNPGLSANIAKKGYELARDYLANDKLAEYVLKTANQVISSQVHGLDYSG